MIVVFGSINVDLVFEAPALPRAGETVLAPDYRALPGGKGANQALAARRAGALVSMYGCVGRDGFAATALELLDRDGVDLSGLARSDRATGCAAVCVDPSGENQIVVASGANRDARADDVPDTVLHSDTTVVLQLEVDLGEIAALIARARDEGARVVLNAAPAAKMPEAALAALDVLIVNRIEATMLAGALGSSEPDPVAAARWLAERSDCLTVVTLGGDGAVAFGAGEAWGIDALAIEPRDTTGAGDTFAGVFAAALDDGAPVADALAHASVAAGLACLEIGAQQSIPTAAMIEARLGELAPARRL
jgi:ribokinase